MKFMYNEPYNGANEKHAGRKWETMNQLGLAHNNYLLALLINYATHRNFTNMGKDRTKRKSHTCIVVTFDL